MDLLEPQQWHGYAYSHNNPTTFSDPTGLVNLRGGGGGGVKAQVSSRGLILMTKMIVRFVVDGLSRGTGNETADKLVSIVCLLCNLASEYNKSQHPLEDDNPNETVPSANATPVIDLGDGRWLFSDGSIRDKSGKHTYSTPGTTESIALGLQNVDDDPYALDEFGFNVGARTYKEWDGKGPWHIQFRGFLNDGKTEIHVNLDGIEDPASYAESGGSVDPATDDVGMTRWELYQPWTFTEAGSCDGFVRY